MVRVIATLFVHIVLMPLIATAAVLCGLFAPHLEVPPHCARLWARLLLAAGGVRIRFEGGPPLSPLRPAIVVMNHASAIDVYIACTYLPIPFRMVAKAELFRIPFLGWAMRAAGFVPLERAGSRRDIERLLQLPWDAEHRACFCFYPEGTRSRDGRLQPFKVGAFVTAIREQVPIVPVAVIGTHRAQPNGRAFPRGGEVTVRVLEPVITAGRQEADRRALADEVWTRLRDALPPDQRPAEPRPAETT